MKRYENTYTTPTQFTNLDSQFLFTFAQTLGNSPEGVRLAAIAQRLQSLDDKLALAQADGTYAEGVIEGQRRILAKSNLIDSRALSARDGRVLVDSLSIPRPRRVPTGHTRKAELAAEAKSRPIVLPAKGKPAKRGHRLEDL